MKHQSVTQTHSMTSKKENIISIVAQSEPRP